MYRWIVFGLFLITLSCQPAHQKLPIIGIPEISENDTIYPVIRDFRFWNQDSLLVTNQDLYGKVYVADFFFTSCPTICPKVKQQMLRINEKYRDDNRLILVSHTIDPKRDTVGKLKQYSRNLGIEDSQKWHFLTGIKDSLHEIASDYMSIAYEDPDAPGGFDHSGRIVLIDQFGHVRSHCNGTDPKDVTRFMKDIDNLLVHEME